MRIALAGNPNSGKTTLFNALTGSNQYVGNWPGVTVEKKEGKLKVDKNITIVDLPGVYSLSPYTLEEVVTRDYLLSGAPSAMINLVDATNLERNLYLTTQLLEIGIPTVIALNMMDLVNKKGDKIDVNKLSKAIGCPIVETTALKSEGADKVANKAIEIAESGHIKTKHRYSAETEKALKEIREIIGDRASEKNHRWYEVKLFERDKATQKGLKITNEEVDRIDEIVKEVEKIKDDDAEAIITNERYEWITEIVNSCSEREENHMTMSDKIDRIVTNRFLALPIFIAVMFVVYYISVTTIGTMVTDFTNDTLFGEWIQPAVSVGLTNIGAADWLISLVVDGIIGGVGSVLGFVPQMMVLFIFLSILEDCGYMARVAFIMDRLFRKFGLSGKSFIPMLISTGCSVPGIMATKTIENDKDRRMTIMTTTFIPCGAKLPVIALILGAMAGTETGGWVAPLFYFMGIGAVVVSGIILKKTRLFAGEPTPFVMELPPYHVPSAKSVLIHMWERSRAFIIKAGTVIFVACAIIWFLSSFGWVSGTFMYLEEAQMDMSILANIGNALSWVFIPVGFGNWQSTVATLTGIVAKENVVGTFGVLFGLGSEIGEESRGLWTSVATVLPTSYALLSFLAFNLLCAPCVAAIGAIKREMASAKWTAFAITYQCVFAYMVALLIYQFGKFFDTGIFTGGTIAALIALAFLLYMLFRPDKYKKQREKAKIAKSNL